MQVMKKNFAFILRAQLYHKRASKCITILRYCMKLSFYVVLTILTSIQLLMAKSGRGQALKEVEINLSLKNENIKAALKKIESKTRFRFAYKEKDIEKNKSVTLPLEVRSVKETLDAIFNGKDIGYTQIENNIILFKTTADNEEHPNLSTQQYIKKNISGIVKDSKGQPLIGVSVKEKGTANGTVTNNEGKFQLTVFDNNAVLVFTYIGFTDQEITAGNQTFLSVTLLEGVTTLNDVVVVGYGTARKSDLTGAVASVKNAQLTQTATVDPVQALQGRLAGVEITSNSGQPGAGTRIRIRGIGTINNSNPLFVVDGYQTSDISFLSPDDIESIEVLKDASAAAIYGSRGANGVVLVTTKKGKPGKPVLNFSTYAGYQRIWRTLPLTTAAGYATLVTEAYQNGGKAVPSNYSQRLQDAITTGAKGTDWQHQIMQNGLIENYNLNYSGGTEQNKYFIGGTYFQQDGTIKNTGLKKYVVRFNNDLSMTKWLTGGIAANYTNSQQTLYDQGLLRGIITIDPLAVPYDANGNYAYADISGNANPVRLNNEQNGNKLYNQNLLANIFLNAKLFNGLTFTSNYGINYGNTHAKNFLPQFYIGITEQRNQSSLTESRGSGVNMVWSNYLNYKLDAGRHSINATLGEEAQQNKFNSITLNTFDLPADPTLQYASAARSVSPTIGSTQYDESLLSYFGRINYSFMNRYLATATLRYDGSSRFLPDKRWGLFPSFSLAWRLSEEEFLKKIESVSSLKIRASYGKLGNQNSAANYGYASVVQNNMIYVFNGAIVQGAVPTQLSNPNIRWETTSSTDIGIDGDFFNYKLSLTADYFIKRTNGMITQLPVPDYVGAAPPRANVGSIDNRGIEIAVTYRNNIGKLNYDLSANFTKINNKVLSLGGATPLASGNVISGLGNTTLTQVGKELAYYYGLKTNGIFHSQAEISAYTNAKGALIQPNAKPGDVKFMDINGDGVISALDRTYLGSATNPSFSYGFSANFSYKAFDLKLFFQGVQGIELVNAGSRYLEKTSNSTGSWPNFYIDRMDRWTPANPTSDQPRMTTTDLNGNDQFSDRFVENGSYLRFKNLQYRLLLTQKPVVKV